MKKLLLLLCMPMSFLQSCQNKEIEVPMRIVSRTGEAHKFRFQKESGLWKLSRMYDSASFTIYNDSALFIIHGSKRMEYPMKKVFSGDPVSLSTTLKFTDSTTFRIDPILMKKNYAITKDVNERGNEVTVAYDNEKETWVVWIKSETQGFLIIGDSKAL